MQVQENLYVQIIFVAVRIKLCLEIVFFSVWWRIIVRRIVIIW